MRVPVAQGTEGLRYRDSVMALDTAGGVRDKIVDSTAAQAVEAGAMVKTCLCLDQRLAGGVSGVA